MTVNFEEHLGNDLRIFEHFLLIYVAHPNSLWMIEVLNSNKKGIKGIVQVVRIVLFKDLKRVITEKEVPLQKDLEDVAKNIEGIYLNIFWFSHPVVVGKVGEGKADIEEKTFKIFDVSGRKALVVGRTEVSLLVLYFRLVGRIRRGLEHRIVIFPHPEAVVLIIQGIVGIGVDLMDGTAYFYYIIVIDRKMVVEQNIVGLVKINVKNLFSTVIIRSDHGNYKKI